MLDGEGAVLFGPMLQVPVTLALWLVGEDWVAVVVVLGEIPPSKMTVVTPEAELREDAGLAGSKNIMLALDRIFGAKTYPATPFVVIGWRVMAPYAREG